MARVSRSRRRARRDAPEARLVARGDRAAGARAGASDKPLYRLAPARARGGLHASRKDPGGDRAPDRRRTARTRRRARSARGALWAQPLAMAASQRSPPASRARRNAAAALAEAVHRAEAARRRGISQGCDRELSARGALRPRRLSGRRIARGERRDADLCAAEPPLHLQSYLEELRSRAVRYCSQATAALPRSEHEPMRHLLVLAALGARQTSARQRRGRAVCSLCAICISPGARRAALCFGNERSIDGTIETLG
jgi:hypothetical protein